MTDIINAIVATHPSHYAKLPAEMRGLPRWALAVAEEVSSGVPGLWGAFVATIEALRPHAPNAGENRHG